MCTLLFAWQVDPARPLIVAANRDEFHARPTAAASTWPRDDKDDDDAPEIVAGRDLQAGGTWLGVTREGRFAALTNVREPFVAPPPGARSRGGLVAEFLRGRAAPDEYLAGLAPPVRRVLQSVRETIRAALHRLKLSWKKGKKLLSRADPAKRAAFVATIQAVLGRAQRDEELLVYIDEAHIHQDADVGYGWSVRGERLWVCSSSPGLSAKASFYGLYLYNEGQVRI